MSFKVKENSSSSSDNAPYERIGACTTVGVIAQLIDFGVQHCEDWQTHKKQYYVCDESGKRVKNGNEYSLTDVKNETPVLKPVIFVTLELPSKTIDVDGAMKPRWISKEITMSAHEKSTMRKWNTAITGVDKGDIDLENWLEKNCLVQIGTTSGGKDKIMSVTPMMEGIITQPLFNGSKVFRIDEPDMEVFESLPQFMKDKITSADNWKGASSPSSVVEDDDCPF